MRFFVLFTSCLLFVGCKFTSPGTNTGNPDLNASPGIGYEGALALGYKVCEKVKSCYAISNFDDCLDQSFNSSNYANELGAVAANFSTLINLRSAEIYHQVSPNKTNFENCQLAIESLTCSDILVQNSYSTNDPENFKATNILFRSSSSCALIY